MYYEEKVIDGKLMWRGTPTGDWIECSVESITKKLIETREAKHETCRWVASDYNLYQLSCDGSFLPLVFNYKFCPYCGKEIEV